MKGYITLIIIGITQLCLIGNALGQDAADLSGTALQFSMTNVGGSARIIGLGGASTALGGDVSAASSNPAGLGFFNRSEFSISSQFNSLSSSSLYLGSGTDDSKLNFNFANIGGVIHSGLNKGKWKSGSVGISINRVVDFQNSISYQGANTQDDFIGYAIREENLNGINDFTDLAFNTLLTDEFFEIYDGSETIIIDGIEYNTGNIFGNNLQVGDSLFFIDRNIFDINNGVPAAPGEDFPSFQEELIETKGAIYKASISYGANYNDMIYLGASIGILSVNKEVERTYIERPTGADLDNLILRDNFEINGGGVLGTFGLIARPITPLLVGITYTTPTYYTLEQVREISLTANYTGFDPENDGIVFAPFEYNVTTPSSVKTGITGFFGKNGFITGEVEWINYGGARLSRPSDGIPFTASNSKINTFESAINYRIGAEYRYDMFRLRAGYSYTDDPVSDQLDQSISEISFGGGIRNENLYLDLGVVTGNRPETAISPFPTNESAIVNTDNTRVTISFGVFL